MISDYEKLQQKLARRRAFVLVACAIITIVSLLAGFISKSAANREKAIASQTQQEAAASKKEFILCEESTKQARELAIHYREVAEQLRLEIDLKKK